jgi:hypothetical protein
LGSEASQINMDYAKLADLAHGRDKGETSLFIIDQEISLVKKIPFWI